MKSKPPATFDERIAQQRSEVKEILDDFERTHGNRIEVARALAIIICCERGKATVHEVHDLWNETYGAETWRDYRGTSYWAGAIFRGEDWHKVDKTSSYYNHNFDGNGVWEWVPLNGGRL